KSHTSRRTHSEPMAADGSRWQSIAHSSVGWRGSPPGRLHVKPYWAGYYGDRLAKLAELLPRLSSPAEGNNCLNPFLLNLLRRGTTLCPFRHLRTRSRLW